MSSGRGPRLDEVEDWLETVYGLCTWCAGPRVRERGLALRAHVWCMGLLGERPAVLYELSRGRLLLCMHSGGSGHNRPCPFVDWGCWAGLGDGSPAWVTPKPVNPFAVNMYGKRPRSTAPVDRVDKLGLHAGLPTTIFTARSWWSNTRLERKFVQICQKFACLNQNANLCRFVKKLPV